MNILPGASIRTKLVSLILIITMLSIVLGFSFVIVNEIRAFRKDLINDTVINAKLVGDYCVSPLTFNQKAGVEDVLKKLKSISSISAAHVFDEKGEIFASFYREKPFTVPNLPSEDNYIRFKGTSLYVVRSITYHDQHYGSIYLIANTRELNIRIRQYVITILILIIGLMIVSYLLAAKFHHIISDPILDLATTTKTISTNGDYSIRVQKQADDEIGVLYDGFNIMLEQIHIREDERDKAEEELVKLNDQLEQKVAEKTDELQERISELERFYNATVDRELRMKELRDKITELEMKSKGQPA